MNYIKELYNYVVIINKLHNADFSYYIMILYIIMLIIIFEEHKICKDMKI